MDIPLYKSETKLTNLVNKPGPNVTASDASSCSNYTKVAKKYVHFTGKKQVHRTDTGGLMCSAVLGFERGYRDTPRTLWLLFLVKVFLWKGCHT